MIPFPLVKPFTGSDCHTAARHESDILCETFATLAVKNLGNYPVDYPGTFSAENFTCFDKKCPPSGDENVSFDKIGRIFTPHVPLGNQLDNSQNLTAKNAKIHAKDARKNIRLLPG